MLANQALADKYPCLNEYTKPVKRAEREIVGREKEIRSIKAAMMRPELCNVMLLAPPGAGKTSVVQGTMLADEGRTYLEVDLAKMIANCKTDVNEMATRLKDLFDETAMYCKDENVEIVLFIDEFHQVVQLSDAAVEALKPLLADSGTRGIRVIAATTYVEFRKYIASNQPLVERLQRINLEPPNKEVTIEILRGMAKRYGVDSQFYNDSVYELIYEYTERYVPANSQPRKSLLVLDAMIGWHRSTGRKMDQSLLADVIMESEGVNVAFKVDATAIKRELDKHVLSQDLATRTIEDRLQICVADLNDKSKPMSTFLFTGSSGSGKMLDDDTPVPVVCGGGAVRVKRHGDLEVGDVVFNRKGMPVNVTGTFPQDGKQDVYLLTLRDGRSIRCGAGHLWTYRNRVGNGSKLWKTATTKQLAGKNLVTSNNEYQFVIPMNGPVLWPNVDGLASPWLAGVYCACGLGRKRLEFGTRSGHVAQRAANELSAMGFANVEFVMRQRSVYFTSDGSPVRVQDVFGYGTFDGIRNSNRFVPDSYKRAGKSQREELLVGLFDASGNIPAWDRSRLRLLFRTKSERLKDDVREVLFSLGFSNLVRVSYGRDGTTPSSYVIDVRCRQELKQQFFSDPGKKYKAGLAAGLDEGKSRVRSYDTVPIVSIEKLPEKVHMGCISVDDPEELYQAGDFVVTHNTETVKQLAKILFDNKNHLIRMDMTEYANPDSLERFRRELTARVWAQPYSIVLLDEIEKACSPVTRILLQVLDDGRLSDENNREVSFTNCYIVMTTNAGSEIYKNIAQYNVDDTGSGEQMARYNKLIRNSIMSTTGDNKFPPELLGRIDCIVPFQPLSEKTMKSIVKMKLIALKSEVMKKHNVRVKIHPDVIDYLVEDNLDTDSDSGGARAVMSKLESEVTTAVAQFINSHGSVPMIAVTVDGELASKSIDKLISTAKIKVEEAH